MLLIVLVSILIDLFFFTGFIGSDDIAYVEGPLHLLRGEGFNVNMANGRLTLVGWNLLILFLTEQRIQVLAASYVFFHQVLNLSTYALARRRYDGRTAMLAMFGTATMPLIVTFSTCILPDVPMACCFVIAVHAFLRGQDARATGAPASTYRWNLLAGASVGIGYMAKESALLLLPYFLVLWALQEWRSAKQAAVIRGLMFAIGFFGIVALETALLSWINGGFHFRMLWTCEDLDPLVRAHIARHGTNPLARLISVYDHLRLHVSVKSLVPLVVACFALYPAIIRKSWPVYFAALWSFAYLTWGTMRLAEYFPPSIQARYYIPVVPFAAIIVAAVLMRGYGAISTAIRPRPAARLARCVMIALVGLFSVLSLGRANRVAGKIYNADLVSNTIMATHRARDEDTRTIVLGAELSRHVGAVLGEDFPSNVRTWAKAASRKQLLQMAEQGGWHMILAAPTPAREPSGYDPMRSPKQWMPCPARLWDQDPASMDAPRVIRSQEPTVPDCVEFAGYRFVVERIARLRAPYTRTAEFAASHFRMLNNWREQCDRFPAARGVLLLSVAARRTTQTTNSADGDVVSEHNEDHGDTLDRARRDGIANAVTHRPINANGPGRIRS